MWADKTSIRTKFFRNMISIAVVSIGLWCLIWIYGEYSDFTAESESLRAEFILSQKEMLKSEVAGVVKYVKYMKEQAEQNLKFALKERVYEACEIALNIYRQNRASKTPVEIGNMIKDALRPIRFNAGRGYYFADSMDGVDQLYPVRPEFEGKNIIDLQDSKGNFVIRDEINIIKKFGEGFVKDYWTKPDKDAAVLFPKISFVKHFKPLDWYFGTGEYLDDAEKQIQDEVLNRIANLRFGTEGYFFGSTFKGESLFSNGKITLDAGNIRDLTDPNGVKIIQKQRKAAKNPGGGFVYYSWHKLNTSIPSPKISYVFGIPEWDWMIGAGVYVDTIENIIITKKEALENRLGKKILKSMFALMALLLLIYFWSRRISSQIKKAIETFSASLKKANTEAVMINPDDFQLREFRDIAVLTNKMLTERIQAEKSLKESEEKLRFITEKMADIVWTMDRNFRTTYVSPSIENVLGFTPEERKQQAVEEMITPESLKRTHAIFLEELQKDTEGTADSERFITSEVEYYHKDGSIVCLENRVKAIRDLSGSIVGFHGVSRDITERKQAEKALKESEEKLARSKKMESLGLLAGGVAHDLNNVLSGIVSYPELILMDLPEESKLRKPVETIMESGNRAAAIVQDLLTVARGVATAKEPLSLNDMVSDYLISPELNKLKQFQPAVTIKTSLDGDLLNVKGSEVHIRKVVMNLTSNAAEAVEGSGSVTISTMNRYLDRPVCGYSEVSIGEYAVLAVSDDGPGISPDDLKKIFEPFYTKKVMGRSGTGLGLAVVWNTMQDHDGYIDVKSDENGTTFELYFPITRDEISDKDLSIPLEDFKGNKETILVVDDVKTQREISCKMLDMLGYITIAVSSGEEAVEYLKENRVDLVLLDMIMDPGINGRETYERIIKIHPGQKAVIISGFADTDEVKKARRAGAGQYIKKPVTLEKLGLAVKEVLEK